MTYFDSLDGEEWQKFKKKMFENESCQRRRYVMINAAIGYVILIHFLIMFHSISSMASNRNISYLYAYSCRALALWNINVLQLSLSPQDRQFPSN